MFSEGWDFDKADMVSGLCALQQVLLGWVSLNPRDFLGCRLPA